MEPDFAVIGGAPPALLPVLEILTGGLLVVGLPLLGLELAQLSRARALTPERVRGMLTSTFCLVLATVVQVSTFGAVAVVYGWVSTLAPWPIPTTWATALGCLLLVDFAYYWEHRLGHEVSLFWASFHATHHSANHFDQTVGLRVSFTEGFANVPLFASHLIIVMIGFHPLLLGACYGLVLAWQQWIHTETVGRLPWLDGWLNTPSNHRVHHGRNPIYLDRNYGGLFMVWDRWFGTYAAETEPVDYGLTHRLTRHHPWWVHFSVWVALARRLGEAQSWREAVGWLLGPPAAWAQQADDQAVPASGKR